MSGAQEDPGLAPVIPIFGGATRGENLTASVRESPPRAAGRRDDVPNNGDVRAAPDPGGDSDPDDDEVRQQAEQTLVRKLRGKQLSVAEARLVLRESDLDRESIDEVLEEFQRRSYLDDRSLASLLVSSGSERKGQGRVALSRTLAQRGIPRDIADDALAELPDDDDERALEFARGKAQSMSRLDFDTALRRLHGQLARRGYGGSVAMNAARTALQEAGIRRTPAGRPSGVRFVESD